MTTGEIAATRDLLQDLVSGRATQLVAGFRQVRSGFGIAQGILADEYRRIAPRADRETLYELFYSFHVTPWLTISPDFQCITNAGGRKGDPHAMIAGIRIRMDL